MSSTNDTVTLELFTSPQPPASPTPSRRRGADEGGSACTTPARPSKAPALVRTHSLPEGFSMGDINMRATDNAVKEITGKDLPHGILPGKAVVKYQKDYSGGKRNAGSVVIMLAKGEDKSVQSVCFYTAPWQIGKKIVEALDEVAKVKGGEGNMKKRHPGLEWVGIDKSRLTENCDYIEKMGWVATPDSCHGAANLVNLVKKLSAELLTSHLPCDYYLGEIIVPEREKTKYQVILDGKLCVLLTRHHCIHLTKTLSNCLHARTLARSHARTLARSHARTHTQVCMRRVDIDTTPEDNADDGSQATAAEADDFL